MLVGCYLFAGKVTKPKIKVLEDEETDPEELSDVEEEEIEPISTEIKEAGLDSKIKEEDKLLEKSLAK